ncbi:hypothetical protein QUF88_24610 [Bacillus sp. DX1.1]|uniref:hypothetical protein n=1 Tax=unclassified Bacillus (in: firmicutes) TaxID=185979 RepID=UPI002570BFF1|nr:MULTISPECIES: hypothetical protein [unclassified Bacillus (in: firmicutes)]MDM5156896.1 hypothetical protein [Bacillus sp. DX1.1]WJE81141.1 hypothetical protein QRE67_22150 [Bacillus sp. DX3.1]
MTLLLFFIGIVFLIFSLSTLGAFNKKKKTKSSQEIPFIFLLLGMAFLGLSISTYVFRLHIL